MNTSPRWFRLLLLLLPPGFRKEFEAEIHEHLAWSQARRGSAWIVMDIIRVAASERLGLGRTNWSEQRIRRAGMAAVAGGVIALAVTPILVLVKYSTGWSIVPRPAWTGLVRTVLDPLVSFATPVQLWMLYGAVYSLALILMLVGILAVRARTNGEANIVWRGGLWVLLVGLSLVLVGDALHSATWHLGGATVPRPGLNAVAGFGMSLAYLGLPIVFLSSFVLGVSAMRHGTVSRTVATLLLVVGPGGAMLTATQVPAMPSGALSVFSVAITMLGYALATESLRPHDTLSMMHSRRLET